MITLLLALFIVLFAISTIDQKKFLELRYGLTETFNPSAIQSPGGSGLLQQSSLVDAAGTNPSPTPVLAGTSAPTSATEALVKKITNALQKGKVSSLATVAATSQGTVVQILADKVYFSSDSANFSPLGDKVIDIVANVVRPLSNDIEVEGFTDDVPVTGGPYANNWELSGARASTVTARLNLADGIAADRLAAVGYGATHPAAPNNTPANEALNRRIDVVILNA
jgi:chemotaxis protein MotB